MQPKSATEILAERLRAAYTKGPIAPMRDLLDAKDGAAAFAVQLCNVNLWKQQGRRMTGRKIGLTSPAVQAQFGVDQPDYGVLFKDTEIDDGGNLDPLRVLQPRAEAEVAITLRRDIDNPDAGLQEVIAAIDCVLPSIEIVDSRIADWKISFADTVADNASCGFYVLGTVPRAITGLDLWTCGMVLEINGKVASIGAGAACLGHPLRAAAWLARTLSRLGEPLRAGEVILTGALGATVPLESGSVISTTIGGIGSCRFTYRSESE